MATSESAGQLERRLQSQRSVRMKTFSSRYQEFLAYIAELKARGMSGSVAWSAAREMFSANTGHTEQEALQFVLDNLETEKRRDEFLQNVTLDLNDEVGLIEFDQKYRASLMLGMALDECKLEKLREFAKTNMHQFDNSKPADDAFRFTFDVLWKYEKWRQGEDDSKPLPEQALRHTRTRAMNAEAAD